MAMEQKGAWKKWSERLTVGGAAGIAAGEVLAPILIPLSIQATLIGLMGLGLHRGWGALRSRYRNQK
jgi:hypothetical protein